MKILFSEHESYYRDLGLKNMEGISYIFNGQKYYQQNIKTINKFDVFCCAFYTMPHNIMLTRIFKKLNKKTILCSDGIFDFANALDNPMLIKYDCSLYHPIIQDYFLCVGERETKYFNYTTRALQFMPERVLAQTELIKLPKYKKILITTANTAYFNEMEFNRLKKLILDIVSLLNINLIQLSFRIFDERLLTSINEELDFNIFNDVKNNFEITIESYSSVITTPSSIAITSMYHQRAVSLLIYRDKPMLLQAGWLIPSSDILSDHLDDFINLNEERIEIQNGLLKSYLIKDGITERLKMIIELESDVKKRKIETYINKGLLNMLNSRFNFNFEWFARNIYLKFKSSKIMKNIRLWIQ